MRYSAEPIIPTQTPRPTLERRIPPTALPTAVVGGDITSGVPVGIELPGQTFVTLKYTADTEQVVSITAKALTDDYEGNVLDVVFEVLDSNFDRVIYVDDAALDIVGFATSDAAVEGLTLSQGDYVIRINAFNGFQRGQIEVTLIVE